MADDGIINTKLARALLAERQFDALMLLENRVRFDDRGLAYWPVEEWPEIVREVDREPGEPAWRDEKGRRAGIPTAPSDRVEMSPTSGGDEQW
jgi:hypothetical protein